jgi:hypothetical protein
VKDTFSHRDLRSTPALLGRISHKSDVEVVGVAAMVEPSYHGDRSMRGLHEPPRRSDRGVADRIEKGRRYGRTPQAVPQSNRAHGGWRLWRPGRVLQRRHHGDQSALLGTHFVRRIWAGGLSGDVDSRSGRQQGPADDFCTAATGLSRLSLHLQLRWRRRIRSALW